MQFTAQDIANLIGAQIEGDATVIINKPGGIENAEKGAITFLDSDKYAPFLYTTKASVVVIQQDFALKQAIQPTLLRVANVRQAFASLLHYYDQASQARPQGISELAYVAPDAALGERVAVGRFATIERGARIGSNVIIHDQAFIGADVVIGDNSVIHTGAKVMHQCVIGQDCTLHANSVVGSEGFGFVPDAQGVYHNVPQIGNVILKDHVNVGANSSIDRATMGSTVIHQGVKLDNLVQIGHNVIVGEHTVIAAQAGIAGSTTIGARCRIGGQVGFSGHITIADGTQIQAQSGIASAITEPNQAWFGSPAIGYRDYIRSYGVYKKLPELYRLIHRLEKELRQLQNGES